MLESGDVHERENSVRIPLNLVSANKEPLLKLLSNSLLISKSQEYIQ